MTADVVVLDTTYPDLVIEKEILGTAGFSVERHDGSTAADVLACSDAQVIIAGSRARFDRDALERLGSRAIVRAGIGVDSVDLEAADSLGITVCHVPHYGTESVAQHTLALALAATRRLGEADRLVRIGEWGFRSTRPMRLPQSSVAGVVGLGRIGARVAELFDAVGFGRVIGFDPYVAGHPVEQVPLVDLLAAADVVSLHVPADPAGEPLIGEEEIRLMKEGSALVNTARGTLIDMEALAAGLRRGRPRVAALDVFSAEPPDLGPLADVKDRLILTPHQAWYTEESQEALRRQSAEEALRILTGQAPSHPVGERS